MIETLQQTDASLLVAVNNWNGTFADSVMWMVSSKWSWTGPVAGLLVALRGKPWRHCVMLLLAVALTFLLADQVASGLIKHTVERLRPTHEPSLEGMVRVVNGYRGGLYGFVSSHAANTVGMTLLLCAVMRWRWFSVTMSLWTALVCYSRMYLGVHYPGDILGGAIVGALAGMLVVWVGRSVERRTAGQWALPQFARADARVMTAAVILTAASILVLGLLSYPDLG